MKYSDYLAQTQRLLQNPGASAALYATSDLAYYINQARNYVAGDAQCVRANGTYSLPALATSFTFAQISISGTGYQETQVINQMRATLPGGSFSPMYSRPFQWFRSYNTGSPISAQGVPQEWAQQGQGSLGTVTVYPAPYATTVIDMDLVALPSALSSDSDPDVIPDQFSSAVPFFAAYLAYLSAQRTADADGMFQKYTQYKDMARKFANGEVLSWQGSQGKDIAKLASYGLRPSGGQ